MPFKISFDLDSWLSHCIIFEIRKKKQRIDRLSDILSFDCFLFLINQKIMLSSSRGQDIFEDLSFEAKDLKMGLRGRPQGQERPNGLHLCQK